MNFEEYWKNFGKLEHEVIKNPRELEDDFYNLAKKIWGLNDQRINEEVKERVKEEFDEMKEGIRADALEDFKEEAKEAIDDL